MAEKFVKDNPSYVVAISVANANLTKPIEEIASFPSVLVPHHFRYELMKYAKLSLATSGTVVLELGLHGVPTAVTYQLSSLNYLLGRYGFRIHLPYYTLVNIICGKEVYPEFIHKKISPEQVYQSLKQLMEKEEACRQSFSELRKLLLNRNASLSAARAIDSLVGSVL